MAWSIFSDGGGAGAALTWARDLLAKIGAPESAGNVQLVYDWEVSEGGGGRYNPLNQGPVPGHPELTSTGPQYGGGAADFVSWAAGLQGAADYLGMDNFRQIAEDLRANDPQQARADIIASPWAASHYGGGSAFSDSPIPGHASALPGPAGGNPTAHTTGFNPLSPLEALAGLPGTLARLAITTPIVLAGAALMVWGAARATGVKQKAQQAAQTAAPIAGAAAL